MQSADTSCYLCQGVSYAHVGPWHSRAVSMSHLNALQLYEDTPQSSYS